MKSSQVISKLDAMLKELMNLKDVELEKPEHATKLRSRALLVRDLGHLISTKC